MASQMKNCSATGKGSRGASTQCRHSPKAKERPARERQLLPQSRVACIRQRNLQKWRRGVLIATPGGGGCRAVRAGWVVAGAPSPGCPSRASQGTDWPRSARCGAPSPSPGSLSPPGLTWSSAHTARAPATHNVHHQPIRPYSQSQYCCSSPGENAGGRLECNAALRESGEGAGGQVGADPSSVPQLVQVPRVRPSPPAHPRPPGTHPPRPPSPRRGRWRLAGRRQGAALPPRGGPWGAALAFPPGGGRGSGVGGARSRGRTGP